eukprot:gb/GECG01011492.1/.p1 GENE.gb/GECG01011492.1/~~gb/GECG01011492.1/.p1  ORF type:complete len:301 (+),score=35.20 gb/GECG01011492.1/:1-903(+)
MDQSTTQTAAAAASSSNLRPNRERHNQSERKRASRVRNEIDSLATILARAGKLAKRDQASILASVREYIDELEHQAEGIPAPAVQPRQTCRQEDIGSIDYKKAFLSSGCPQAIVSLAGNFLDCNSHFCSLTGYRKEQLLQLSIFSMTPPEEMQRTRSILGELLSLCETESSKSSALSKSFYKDAMFHSRRVRLHVKATVVCDDKGSPKHLVCSSSTHVPSEPDVADVMRKRRKTTDNLAAELCGANGNGHRDSDYYYNVESGTGLPDDFSPILDASSVSRWTFGEDADLDRDEATAILFE